MLLSNSLDLQIFLRDAKQAEVLLNQQEHYLSKDETPVSCFYNFCLKMSSHCDKYVNDRALLFISKSLNIDIFKIS